MPDHTLIAAAPLPPEPRQDLGLDRDLDYRTAFDLAPIGLVLSRHRLMVDCNQEMLSMFGATRDEVLGHSFEVLYPPTRNSSAPARRITTSLDASGRYADDRIMKRLRGTARRLVLVSRQRSGAECRRPARRRHLGVEDLSSKRSLKADFTPRERESPRC